MATHNAAFKTTEYARRIAKTRSAMAAAGLAALFVTDPSNHSCMGLLTGTKGKLIAITRVCFDGTDGL